MYSAISCARRCTTQSFPAARRVARTDSESGSRRCPTPTAYSYRCPDRLDQPERPSPLEEAVGGPQGTRSGEGQDEPMAPMLQGVAEKHRGHGKQPEPRETTHSVPLRAPRLVSRT